MTSSDACPPKEPPYPSEPKYRGRGGSEGYDGSWFLAAPTESVVIKQARHPFSKSVSFNVVSCFLPFS